MHECQIATSQPSQLVIEEIHVTLATRWVRSSSDGVLGWDLTNVNFTLKFDDSSHNTRLFVPLGVKMLVTEELRVFYVDSCHVVRFHLVDWYKW